MTVSFTRRKIIKTGFLAAGISFVTSKSNALNLLMHPGLTIRTSGPMEDFKIGIASYTFRKLSLEDTIKAMQRLNLHYISIKDLHLALTSTTDERKNAIQKLRRQKLSH